METIFTEDIIGPYGSYIIAENTRFNTLYKEQKDDNITEEVLDVHKIIDVLKAYPQYEQKSIEWLTQRKGRIGGSESACVLGMNHYEPQYNFIKKKVSDVPFVMNFKNLWWGNATEDVAVLLYELLYNVKIDEYGFLPHETLDFIGASPDGIVGMYKRDGIHLTDMCGRMVEIKSVTSRRINMDPESRIVTDIVPEYYITQVYQQLETCKLKQCDFLQIRAQEYETYNDFKEDTNEKYPYLSKDNKFKGLIVQLLPKEIKDLSDPDTIYKNAKFRHPPKLDMTLKDSVKWYKKIKKEYENNEKFYIHKVLYYKLEHARCTPVKHNSLFFNSKIPVYKQMWDYVLFLRNHTIHCDMFLKSINYFENNYNTYGKNRMKVLNKIILNFLDDMVKIEDLNNDSIEKLFNTYDIKSKEFYKC